MHEFIGVSGRSVFGSGASAIAFHQKSPINVGKSLSKRHSGLTLPEATFCGQTETFGDRNIEDRKMSRIFLSQIFLSNIRLGIEDEFAAEPEARSERLAFTAPGPKSRRGGRRRAACR